jgi:alkylation response protein AidB-like acyl-CoA dehydrogenase
MSAEVFLAHAQAIADQARARSTEIEGARRLPEDLARAMARGGLMRLYVPQAYGGAALSPSEANQVFTTLAQGDASTAWCAMIAATTAITAAYLPSDHARTVFGSLEGITGGVFAPLGKAEVDGANVIVTGRWAWASGSVNCDWLMGGCVVMEGGAPRLKVNGQPETRMFIAPRAAVELIDTWHVSGLRGTGSGDMAMHGVVIPFERSVSLTDDAPHFANESAAFRMPVFSLLATGIAAVARGNALGALAEFQALAGAKKPQGSSRTLGARAAVQDDWARAYATFCAAEAFFDTSLGRLEALHSPADLNAKAHLRLACAHLTQTAADLCRTLYDLGGGESVYERSPLQRRFRDAHVATQHIMVARGMFETTGRALLSGEGDWSTL